MTQLFGRSFTQQQLLSYVGDLSQAGGIRLAELKDSKERSNRIAEVRSGAGLRYTVLLDRGMDIGLADFCGIPLAYVSPAGFAHPTFYEPHGLGWLYTFGGGLMLGCGLTFLGDPQIDQGEDFGLHGRLSHLPASKVNYGETWQGDECIFWIEGEMRQVRVHGEYLSLNRRISTVLGQNTIRIEDSVENRADKPSPLMVMYHINTGFPLLTEHSYLQAVPHEIIPYDEESAARIAEWNHYIPPAQTYLDQTFYHDIPPDEQGWSKVELVSPDAGLTLTILQKKEALPYLVQWKKLEKGVYLMGLEPSNSYVAGRRYERTAGRLRMIQAGETRRFEIEISVNSLNL